MFDRLATYRPLLLNVRPTQTPSSDQRPSAAAVALDGRTTLTTACPVAGVAPVGRASGSAGGQGRWMARRAEQRPTRHNDCVLEGRRS
jgi:hypothetical protein